MIPTASVIPQLLLPQGALLAVGPLGVLAGLALTGVLAFLVRGAIAELRAPATATALVLPADPGLEQAA